MNVLLKTIEVKLFIKENNTDFIKYDHDGGHSYSFIQHSITDNIEDYPELEDMLNNWLYENDECPPCGIHFHPDGHISSGCGCNDGIDMSDALEIVSELEEFTKDLEYGTKYLVTRY